MVGDENLIAFAKTNGDRLLAEAYDPVSGSWTRGMEFKDGKLVQNVDKEWWIYAELDQMTATLSLSDSSYVDKYLKSTVNWWFNNMVDEENHEVWCRLSFNSQSQKLENICPKQWNWKNGYHTYEHALVGYITATARSGGSVKLYFARQQGKN